jgi:uncharacterized protein (DUF58 family)
VNDRASPGELTIVAVATLVTAGYAFARAAQTGLHAAVVVGLFAVGLFAVGLVWPVLTLRGVGAEVDAPRDAVAGDEIELRVRLTGRARRLALRTLDPPGPWYRARAPGEGRVVHRAQRRGVFRFLRVELRAAGPLGVLSRRRLLVVELPAPVLVGPRPVPARWTAVIAPADERAGGAPVPAGLPDAVRAVRPYAPGDPARLVHWPSTARTGALVVRELEPPSVVGVALLVDLRGDDRAAVEATAARAAGLGRAVLAAGGRLLLGTAERTGPVLREVDATLELSRRLARAVGGPLPAPPPGWPVEVVQAAVPGGLGAPP